LFPYGCSGVLLFVDLAIAGNLLKITPLFPYGCSGVLLFVVNMENIGSNNKKIPVSAPDIGNIIA